MNNFQCNRCGYKWQDQKQIPEECPECQSPTWYIEYTREDILNLLHAYLDDQQFDIEVKRIEYRNRRQREWE